MATPIPLELPARDPREALYHRLESAPQEHAEALLAAYDVLQGLHDKGMLEMMRGALGSSEHLLQIVVDAANKPEAIRAMRNLVVLAKLAGSVEPELLEQTAGVALAEIARAKAREPLTLWQLFKKLRSKDTRRALTALTYALESTGKGLNPDMRS